MRIAVLAAAFSLGLGAALAAPGLASDYAASSAPAASLQTVAHGPSKKKARHPILSRDEVIDKLQAKGYHRIKNVRHPSYGLYTATAKTKRGRTVSLRVSAYTGAVLSVRRV